jgi:hypothetical protein
VVTLEPWKGLGYTRWNTPFALDAGGGVQARGRKVVCPVEVVDIVFIL